MLTSKSFYFFQKLISSQTKHGDDDYATPKDSERKEPGGAVHVEFPDKEDVGASTEILWDSTTLFTWTNNQQQRCCKSSTGNILS
jgi:hypothetical protein